MVTTLQDNIRQAMQARGLNTMQLAIECEASYFTVNAWLTGARVPNAANLRRLSTALGVSIDDLLE